jgi:hypothetical protein
MDAAFMTSLEPKRRGKTQGTAVPFRSLSPTAPPPHLPGGGLRARLRRALDDPQPWGLWTYLALGLLLRLPAVLFAHGYFFADHQFQYVDPAWHLATGADALPTDESIHHLRSLAYPGLLAGIFRLVIGLGVSGPLARMVVVRAAHALLSCVALAAFWLVVARWRPVARPRRVLLFFAAAGVVVYSAVQPTALTLSAQLVTAGVLLFLGPSPGAWFASGLCVGLAFACRVQDALFGPVLFGAALWLRRWRTAAWFAAGTVLPIVGQGILDAYTAGGFLQSAFNYVDWNVVQHKSALWRQRGWFYYPLLLVPMLGFFPPFLRPAMSAMRRGAKVMGVPLFAALFYVAALSFVGRKSVRFLAPSFNVLVAVLAVGLYAAPLATISARWHRRIVAGVQVALLLVGSFSFAHRGAIDAALALRERPDFRERLVVVDGWTRIGGMYYLGRDELDVVSVEREKLAAWLAEHPGRPLYLMVVRKPLEPMPGVEPIGRFADVPDFWAGERRFLYRVVRDAEPETAD